jgi:hypothetical protein
MTADVVVVAASALGPHGSGWRGLGKQAAPATFAVQTPAIPSRLRKMASRAAELATVATRAVLDEARATDAAWSDGASVGFWLGVGASGGSVGELEDLLAASGVRDGWDVSRFADAGLAAVNPLFAFQLMNNFTLCHAAILEGLGGPNGAYFSRGAGTVWALIEARAALEARECDRAVAGGADSALHAVTAAELVREGFGDGHPAEGAALLALCAAPLATSPLARLVDCRLVTRDLGATAAAAVTGADVVVLAPWGPPARAKLPPGGLDLSAMIGNPLAAGPALAWCAALDLLVDRGSGRAVALSLGVDGELGVTVFERG